MELPVWVPPVALQNFAHFVVQVFAAASGRNSHDVSMSACNLASAAGVSRRIETRSAKLNSTSSYPERGFCFATNIPNVRSNPFESTVQQKSREKSGKSRSA